MQSPIASRRPARERFALLYLRVFCSWTAIGSRPRCIARTGWNPRSLVILADERVILVLGVVVTYWSRSGGVHSVDEVLE